MVTGVANMVTGVANTAAGHGAGPGVGDELPHRGERVVGAPRPRRRAAVTEPQPRWRSSSAAIEYGGAAAAERAACSTIASWRYRSPSGRGYAA
jgi:hypothetical protein